MNDEQKIRRLELQRARVQQKLLLPHLYGKKFYAWSRAYFESKNHINLLCAGNQVSKSSTAIRKAIHWATESSLWADLWPSAPKQFWYLYPTLDVATIEFKEKWVKEWLPQGEMKNHKQYGWKEEFSKERKIHNISFNSGVTIYFKSYATDVSFLQSSSVYAMFCDEELPVDLYDELLMRMSSPLVNGYFHMVFTATMGQVFWYRAIEKRGKKDEVLPQAFKQQISMYDCLTYEDGSPGAFTELHIKTMEARLPENERKKRIHGKFILSNEDLVVHAFRRDKHIIKPHPLPGDWGVYCGVDIGSGGPGGKKGSHPPGIAFVAISPDFKHGRVIKIWVPEAHEQFTAGDVYTKYKSLARELGRPIISCYYDHQSKDFKTVAERAGDFVEHADKTQTTGQDIMNTLFKCDMLLVWDLEGADVLASQFETLKKDTPKQHAWDDGVDAVRFAISRLPWNFEALGAQIETLKEEEAPQDARARRHKEFRDQITGVRGQVEDADFEEWQAHIDGSL